jgi:membrane fusion protein (multidrug efflux system)
LSIAILLAVAAAGYAAYERLQSKPSNGTERTGRAGAAKLVETAPSQMRRMETRIEAVGTSLARQSITVVALTAGRVKAVLFRAGQQVKRGDALVELDSEVEQADVKEAEAGLKEAELALDRAKTLQERNSGPQMTVDQQIAKVAAAQAKLDRGRKKLTDRRVIAAFGGVVGIRRVDVGARIDDSTVITTLDDLSEIEIEFQVPENYFSRMKVGQAVTATTASFPGRVFAGKTRIIDSRIDPVGRAFKVRASLPNPDLALPAGMFMLVQVVIDSGQHLAVPEAAILPEAGNVFVFVIADGKVERRKVTLGRREVGFVEVSDGLQPNEQVVVKGFASLREGDRVRQVNERNGNERKGDERKGA